MPLRRKRYRMDIGATVTPATNDDQAGDEAWADAFSASVTGLDATWNTPIDFDSQVPTGLTVNASGRVTAVDLRSTTSGMGLLGGSLDIPEWENIKQCGVINFAFNNFDTQYPSAIHNIGSSLEYLYLNYSDHSEVWDASLHPHEGISTISVPVFDQGKDSGTGNNIIRGSVGDDIDNLTGLKWFVLSWSDDFGSGSRVPNTINGIEDISQNFWNITSLELVAVYDNWNIGTSGNTFELPSTIGHLSSLKQVYMGGGTGSQFDYNAPEADMMQGTYPSDLGTLTQFEVWWVQNLGHLTGFPDLSGSAGLLKFLTDNNDLTGESFPDSLVDGTHPDLDSIVMDYKSIDPKGGMTGGILANWGIPKLDNFNIRYHGFTGTVPTGLWDTDPAKCDVGVNSFTSLGRQDLTGLVSMVNIAWYRNEIEAEPLPYFDWSRNDWNIIRFEQNRYVFSDMLYVPPNAPSGETTFVLIRDNLSPNTFSYSPQNPAGTANTYSSTDGNGDIVIDDFDSTYSHADNTYQWQKDGSDIAGATSKTYTISGATSSDNGIYTLVVTNPGIPDLTLTSAEITVNL